MRRIAFMNQKGGVGKTTTSFNLAGCFANMGYKVLCVDLDAQANLSISFGLNPDEIELTSNNLLVDDDISARQVVLKTRFPNIYLIPADIRLAGETAEGHETLRLVRNEFCDVLVLDINMPGMNGFEFCENVQRFCDLPVILLTAIDEEETVIRGIEQYAEDYITKPFSPRILIARVRAVLRRSKDPKKPDSLLKIHNLLKKNLNL